MSNSEGLWTKWLRNGRLATIALFVVAAFWYFYQTTTPVADRDATISYMLQAMIGLWVGNIAFAQGRKEQAVEHKVDMLQEQLGATASRADRTEARADASEEREHGPSLHLDGEQRRGRHAERD